MNVLAPCFAKQLRKDIAEQHFSFIIDESTNDANVSCLALSVRYYSATKKKIVDTFFRLVPLQDCTADTLQKTEKVHGGRQIEHRKVDWNWM